MGKGFMSCIPIRPGLWIATTYMLIVGTAIATLGYFKVAHADGENLGYTKQQKQAVLLSAIVYSILVAIALMGHLGHYLRHMRFVKLYSTLLWFHLGVNIATGSYLLWTLTHPGASRHDLLNECHLRSTEEQVRDTCQRTFALARGLTIGLSVTFWVVEFVGCFVVANYLRNVDEEESSFEILAGPPAAGAGHPAPMLVGEDDGHTSDTDKDDLFDYMEKAEKALGTMPELAYSYRL
ncbi:hypothetical protein OF83DRAFT_1169968 [Amylostereum chailletii]|nr:hypothetical protein OF83DRAFT_1169968 [Amylostereum chailletii]